MTSAFRYDNDARRTLLKRLAREAYRRGQFTLASGRESEHYVNCKPVSLSGSGLALISSAMLDHVDAQAVAVAGLTLGADPLVSGVAMAAALVERPLDALIVRKQAKGHGTGAWLEGPLPQKGALITVLEDVSSSGPRGRVHSSSEGLAYSDKGELSSESAPLAGQLFQPCRCKAQGSIGRFFALAKDATDSQTAQYPEVAERRQRAAER